VFSYVEGEALSELGFLDDRALYAAAALIRLAPKPSAITTYPLATSSSKRGFPSR